MMSTKDAIRRNDMPDTVHVAVFVEPVRIQERSEVASLMRQIEQEYEAGQQAMYGLALGTARHDFITQRMENMAQRIEELRTVVGEAVAMQMMIAWQDRLADSMRSEVS
jgi:hypothetical protein